MRRLFLDAARPSSGPSVMVLALLAAGTLLGPWGGCATSQTNGVGGGGTGGGGQGGDACAKNEITCEGVCVDPNTDPKHCGLCDIPCSEGQTCFAGKCALMCVGGTTRCGETCRDLAIDADNCGACGAKCPEGQACEEFACALRCTGGTARCDQACVDILIDPSHCGDCDTTCAPTQVCSSGDCVHNCPPGLLECNGGCVDPTQSNENCGVCGQVCGPGEVCTGGSCQLSCAPGLVDCGGVCRNLANDPTSCGMCDLPCAPNQACFGGSCVGIAPADASCFAVLQNGTSIGNGIYNVDPDGPGGDAPFQAFCDMTDEGGGWTRCLNFFNTEAEDVNDNTWLDHCIDWSMAAWTGTEILVKLEDDNGGVLYLAKGTRDSAWTHALVTSSAAPIDQYDVSKHGNLVTLSTGDKLMIAGNTAANGGCWGSIGNGYGLAIYPAFPAAFQNVKVLVTPYRDQVTDNQKRAFGLNGMGWTQANEVSYAPAGFDTCNLPALPAQLGRFSMYVR